MPGDDDDVAVLPDDVEGGLDGGPGRGRFEDEIGAATVEEVDDALREAFVRGSTTRSARMALATSLRLSLKSIPTVGKPNAEQNARAERPITPSPTMATFSPG